MPALIEVAPSVNYVNSNVLQDDLIFRASSSNKQIVFSTTSNSAAPAAAAIWGSNLSVAGVFSACNILCGDRLGVGTSNPGPSRTGTIGHLYGASGHSTMILQSMSNNGISGVEFWNSNGAIQGHMCINQNGALMISQWNSNPLWVNWGNGQVLVGNNSTGSTNAVPMQITASNNCTSALVCKVAGSNTTQCEIKFDKSGYSNNYVASVGLGNINRAFYINVNNSNGDAFRIGMNGYLSAIGVYNYTGSGSGVVVDTNGNLMRSSSSLRYKNVIGYDSNVYSGLLDLQPVIYSYKMDEGNTPQYGLIAEEVSQAGLDELVITDGNGQPDAIDYGKIGVMLIPIVKQLNQRVSQLEAMLAAG